MRRVAVVATLLLTMVILPQRATAQRRGLREVQPMPRVELTPYAGWQFGGGVTTSIGEVKARAAVNFGGILGFRMSAMQVVEITYNYQKSPLVLERGGFGGDSTLFDVITHYIHIGGRAERETGAVTPFVVGGVGLSIFDPAERGRSSETRFSGHLGVGIRAPLSPRVALRGQFRGWFTFTNSWGGFICGGGGCSVTAGGSGILQGDVSGGLTIGF
jgi:hypothetical protein